MLPQTIYLHMISLLVEILQVFDSVISCDIAHIIHAAALTTSSWYLIFVALERFLTIYFPLKVIKSTTNSRKSKICHELALVEQVILHLPLSVA